MRLFLSIIFSFQAVAFANESVVPFELKAETCVSQAELWEQLQLSMLDSNETWMWPNKLSEVHGDGISIGSQIDVTYKWFFLSNTFSYEIKDVSDGIGFSYESIEGEHAFKGGATISIVEENERIYLSWIGQYTVQRNQWIQRAFFDLYTKRLFKKIRQRLYKSCH